MTKIFELKDKLNEIEKYIEINKTEGKIDEVLISLIDRQNDLLNMMINKIEEISTKEELEDAEDKSNS